MQLVTPTEQDIPAIIRLAKDTWQATYQSFIPQAQIDYMLERFYSAKLIQEQIVMQDHFFLLAKKEDELLGYSHCLVQPSEIKLSKLYIHPRAQGLGIGKKLLCAIESFACERHISRIVLNVNIHNPAQHFYKKMGFELLQRVDISLQQFWLNDYILEKKLSC
jgi:ribosomal protein S18 acetylase RimI-like enzyme